jgi:mannose-6-phosphate isomerase class I
MNHSYPPYDLAPHVQATDNPADCALGWEEIRDRFKSKQARVIAVELYPGADGALIARNLGSIFSGHTIRRTEDLMLPAGEIDQRLAPVLTDDPVFGVMNAWKISDFFDENKLAAARQSLATSTEDVLVIGVGASLLADRPDLLIYADLARWEIQRRQRNKTAGNIGVDNAGAPPAALYKRAFFVDWRAADRLKASLLARIDFLLDTNDTETPKLISGDVFRAALRRATTRPFRVVPFFDPGPWGGQWMKARFHLPDGPKNYAWGFDCVPEENSLLLGFGDRRVEVPALDLVLAHPRELLGDSVYRRFGAEFPIRFDFLDTMEGGNLSLQVHPLRDYIRSHFGMDYTQDESYYMLAAGDDAVVFLGLKEGIDREELVASLREAQRNKDAPFPAEKYVNAWPARAHDHFLIPAGTIHCSGRNSVVLEISATPYIFTFKLWDWGRMGLDGKPRPIHLDRGVANLQWDRTTSWVKHHLVNRIETLAQRDGVREERTGLHELEFIETRRHWFTQPVAHDTEGNLNVLCLVEGEEIVVTSPTGAFAPFPIHYGETFIVPAAVGPYMIRPVSNTTCATLKAYVRKTAESGK